MIVLATVFSGRSTSSWPSSRLWFNRLRLMRRPELDYPSLGVTHTEGINLSVEDADKNIQQTPDSQKVLGDIATQKLYCYDRVSESCFAIYIHDLYQFPQSSLLQVACASPHALLCFSTLVGPFCDSSWSRIAESSFHVSCQLQSAMEIMV
jgi:hypothetical protein